jgi:DNA-binding transcriptional MocR family regulator
MLGELAGGTVSVERPDGGLHLWVRADDALDWDEAALAAQQAGANIATRRPFAGASDGTRFRLGYAQFRVDDLERGLEALCGALVRSAG